VNAFDIVIALVAVAAVVGGFRRGFVARASSWVGIGIGLYAGARLVPWVADHLEGADELSLLSACAALLLACTFLGHAVGAIVGSRLRVSVGQGAAHRTDQAFGALAGLVAVAVVLWFLLPSIAAVPSWPSDQARSSVVATAFHDLLPPAPDALQGLSDLVGGDRFPEVFAGLQPAPEVGEAPAASGLSAEVAQEVRRSTVKVLGEACDRLQEGSGFVAAPDVIVTNAHVVAGTTALAVELSDGTQVAARVVFFDPATDVAILRAPGIDRDPLVLATPDEGDRGGVFGYTGGGELQISPFEVARVTTAVGSDIYDEQPTRREVLFLASELAPGDSGAALADAAGRVIGLAFAIAPDDPGVAYALDTSEVRSALADAGSSPVATGPCL
jgi:S1-C subfamily serine protease